MEITSGYRDRYFHLVLTGQLWEREDLEMLERQVEICLNAKRPWIILDLFRLTFINSQALGQLVRIHRQCIDAGGKLILFRPQSNVREVIEVSDFPQFIAVADSEEGLESFMA